MAAPSGKDRGVQNRGLPTPPAWATEPPVWGEPIGFEHVGERLKEIDRKKVYRFAYSDGSVYETTWPSEAAAKTWARQNGHRYLGEVERERPTERTPRDLGSRRTEPSLSPPPLVQAESLKPPPPKKKPAPKKKPPEPKKTPPAVPDTPPPRDDDPVEELKQVKKEINKLRPELEKTRHEAKSKTLDAIPGIGFVASALYDFFVADDPGSAAQGLAEEGLEKSVEHTIEHSLDKTLPPGLTGPKDAWELHQAMMEHGENVKKMQALMKRRYLLMDKLGMPDARYDLPGTTFYIGPKGLLYDKRTGRPAARF